jgi:hypothetical protein
LRARLIAALILLIAALVGLVLEARLNLTTTSLRTVAWLVLMSGALLQVRLATTPTSRRVAQSIAFGSAILAASVPMGAMTHQPWMALLLAGIVWLLCSTLPRVLRPPRRPDVRRTHQLAALEGAFRELQVAPSYEVNAMAQDTLRLLAESSPYPCSVGALARRLEKPWAQVWVISAVLADAGEVEFDRADLSDGAGLELSKRTVRGESATWQTMGGPKLLIHFGDQILPGGVKKMSGDRYKISGSNVSGAVGRNTVRDITTINQESQTVTPADLVAELHRVAERLPQADGDELREAAGELDEAKEGGAIRRIVERVVGIATALGPEGVEMIKLARMVLEQVTSR